MTHTNDKRTAQRRLVILKKEKSGMFGVYHRVINNGFIRGEADMPRQKIAEWFRENKKETT